MKKKEFCIYTCLVGDYDALIHLSYIDEDYDYICFTNQKQLLSRKYYGPWEIRPLLFEKLDATRNNRWHKILGCYELEGYISSIYIDSNIDILSEYIYTLGKMTKKELLIPKHFVRSCIYDELDYVLDDHKETRDVVETVYNLLIQEGMPHSYGLTENNVILRKHSSQFVYNIMSAWWSYVVAYSKRDQLSLMLILWKNNISSFDIMIPNVRIDSVNFRLYPHLNNVGVLQMLDMVKRFLLGKYMPFQAYHYFIKMFFFVIKGKLCYFIRR